MRYAQASAPSKLDEPKLGCTDTEIQKLEEILERTQNEKTKDIGRNLRRLAQRGIGLSFKQRNWIQTAHEWSKPRG